MKIRRRLLALVTPLLAASALAVLPGTAQAVGTVDQDQPAQDGSISMLPGLAQTFTVARTGRFDGVSLTSPSGGRVLLQVYALRADGTPDIARPMMAGNQQAVILAGTTVQVPLPSFPVVAGQRYALAIGVVSIYDTVSLATATGDPYAGGQLFQVPGIYTFNPVPGVDLRFATYVTDAPAPTTLSVRPLTDTAGRPTAVLTSGGAPVAGRTVSFELRRPDQRVKDRCSAVTDTTGTATCTKARWLMPAGGSLLATFAGDATYAPTTATTL